MKYQVKIIEEKQSSTGKPMWRATFQDPDGNEEALNIFDKVEGEVEGEIYTNDKGYKNFKPKSQAVKSNYMAQQKEKVINEAMDKKANQIHAAQDRSAWMWAKTSACTLIANKSYGTAVDTNEEVLENIHKLATKIYNMEPLTPF